MKPLPRDPARILIRSTNWIGDAVMTTPAIRGVRTAFPQAEISLLALPWVADVFRASPRIDRIVRYEKTGRHRGLSGRWRLIRELRGHGYDMVLLLQNAFEAALVTTLARIPVRAGYPTDGRRLLLTHVASLDPSVRSRHEVYYYLGILAGIGLEPGPADLELFLDQEARAEAAALLAALSGPGPLIGLNPGAAYGPAKRWPPEQYAALARMLVERNQARLVVFGTDADREAARLIRDQCGRPGRVLDLTGRTSLAGAMACIDQCRVFVTNDSGLMHVAAALDTPLVAVFGSTNHVATGPFCDQARIVRKENLDCGPCKKTVCPHGHLDCMRGIEPARVHAAVSELLERQE